MSELKTMRKDNFLQYVKKEDMKLAVSGIRFPMLDKEEFCFRTRYSARFKYCFKRVERFLSDEEYGEIACLWIEEKGAILNIWGNEDFKKQLKQDGIMEGVLTDIAYMGPNAINIGIRERRKLSSIGEEHVHPVWKKYAVYFCPALFERLLPPYGLKDYGGVAVIVPAEGANYGFRMLCDTIVHDIIVDIHMVQWVRGTRMHVEKGMMAINFKDEEVPFMITDCNGALCEITGLKRSDVVFRSARKLFPENEKNAAFWEALKAKKDIKNLECMLQLENGKSFLFSVDLENYSQEYVNLSGVNVVLTSTSHIAKGIAQKTGYNAVVEFDDIIGEDEKFKLAKDKGKQFARFRSNIMLLGESGSGKDVFAQAIHNASDRRNGPFIAINCGAIPRDLIASELFGYEAGAFTGAKKQGNIGKMELADGGTLFLDELGELPIDLQATLLRAVENKSFTRVGGTKEIHVDIKIISATNADIWKMISDKLFREDLFYRLGTVCIEIPPLRERGDDCVLLAEHFINRTAQKMGRSDTMGFSEEAVALIRSLPWKGNVREMQNLMDTIAQLCPSNEITPEYITGNIPFYEKRTGLEEKKYPQKVQEIPVKISRHGQQGKKVNLTKEEILEALQKNNGNKSDAAKCLNVARRTLYTYMKIYELGEEFQQEAYVTGSNLYHA